MKKPLALPADPLGRFKDLYLALNDTRRWFEGAAPLRFAAMSAMLCPGDARSVAAEIRRIAERIRAESGWFGPLKTELRFIIAAMLLLHGDTARGLLDEVKRVQRMFRDAGVRRGAVYETMAIFVLRMQAEQRPVPLSAVHRFKAIYEEMKTLHWWLTGPDDFPACAVLTGRPESVALIGSTIERIYQALRREGFSPGDPLQTAANLLFLAQGRPTDVARRYRDLADGFRRGGVSIWKSDYDELAILSFLEQPVNTIVDRVLRYREDMKRLRPRPDRLLTFNLASSIAFCDLVQFDSDMKTVTDAKALLDMQAILAAQQAAATTAATTAATP